MGSMFAGVFVCVLTTPAGSAVAMGNAFSVNASRSSKTSTYASRWTGELR